MRPSDVILVTFVAVLLLTLFALPFLYYQSQVNVCRITAEGIGVPGRYSRYVGCQIEVEPNMWIPVDSYRYEAK